MVDKSILLTCARVSQGIKTSMLSCIHTIMPSRIFSSPFNSILVEDPEKKGRITRQIPQTSLPLLSCDLTYVIVPNRRRKEFCLVLKPGECLEVRTPLIYTAEDMLAYEKYIVSQQEWILHMYDKYHRQEENSPESLVKIFPDREYILYLGEKYPFHIQHQAIPPLTWVSQEKDYFEIKTDTNDSEDLRAALSNWYLKKAREILPPLVEAYAATMKLPVPDLEYSNTKSRWAVCYPTRNLIRFNTLILKTPLECIEYLVIHELSHFYIVKHNKGFWDVVSTYMPDYDERRKKLGTYRAVL